MSANRGRSHGDDTDPRLSSTDDADSDFFDRDDDDELDDEEAAFTQEDSSFDSRELDVHAANEIGDPYAVNSLDDLAKDGSEDLEAYRPYESTLGLPGVADADRRATESGTWENESQEIGTDLSTLSTQQRQVTDDDDEQSVWTRSSESVNAPLFHSAELKQMDTFQSVIESMESISEERVPTPAGTRRESPKPPPAPEFLGYPPASEFFAADDRESSYSSAGFEVESQDVIVEQKFKDKVRDGVFMKRSGQVAIASVIGLVLGWMAWGGGDDKKSDKPDASAQVAAVSPDAGVKDAGEVVVAAGDTDAAKPEAKNEDAAAVAAAKDVPVAGDAGVFATDDAPKPAVAEDNGCAVIIHSKPSGASVWVKEEVIGKTPYRGKLPCHKTAFLIKRDNYKPVETERRLRDDGLNKINVELDRPNYRVRVTSSPSRAVVRINGKVKGRTPLALKLPGYTKAKIVIDRPGHRTWKRTMIPQTAGEVVKATLEPSKGKKSKNKKRRNDG